MLIKTEGIVLRTIKYSETSVISKVFTREQGECSFIVYGIRGSRNKSRGSLFQPLQVLELDVYYRPNKSLFKLKDYRPGHIYSHLYADMLRQSVAIFALEVLSKCIHEQEVNTQLYDYFREFLMSIDTTAQVDPLSPQRYLQDLSKILGFSPSIDTNYQERPYFNLEAGIFERELNALDLSLNKKDTFLLHEFLREETTSFSKAERLKILDILLTYFKIHIPNFNTLTSLDILRTILN